MPLERIDLNLLRVFDAVYEDRSVALAGKRLSLSQSAISHALTRLRGAVEDDLFVRTGKGLEPTVRAHGMATQVRDALQTINVALRIESFEPKIARRKFVVAANDFITSLVCGRLSQRLHAEAPSADLLVRSSTRLDLAGQIDVGRIDLAVGIFSDVPARFASAPLWEQRDAVLVHREHPVASRSITLDDFLTYPLVTISQDGEDDGASGGIFVERGLARQSEVFNRSALAAAFSGGSSVPRIRMSVAHALSMPALLRFSDMMALVPSPLGRELERHGELKMLDVPYTCSPVTVRAVWHERNDSDSAHRWLREQLTDVARQVHT